MKETKVAFIVAYPFVPPKNGGHKAAYGFADFLARHSQLICISGKQNNNDAPFKLISLFSDHLVRYVNPFVGWKIFQVLKKEGVRFCIFHQPFMFLLVLPFLKAAKIPSAIYIQNIEFQRFRSLKKWWWPLMKAFEMICYKNADHLFFIAPTDMAIAQSVFGFNQEYCTTIPYGTYREAMPTNRKECRARIIQKHGFTATDKLLLFFGPQSYLPNLQAVLFIVNELYPLLKEKAGFRFQILICGGGLPEEYLELFNQLPNLHYLGYVEDIDAYIKAADLMLNPISTGGGVKTKVIESIALGTTVISFESGAKGVDLGVSRKKLILVPDKEDNGFAEAIIQNAVMNNFLPTPAVFYEQYYWGNSIKKVLEVISNERSR